jgi:hypothetical protein
MPYKAGLFAAVLSLGRDTAQDRSIPLIRGKTATKNCNRGRGFEPSRRRIVEHTRPDEICNASPRGVGT